MVKSRKNSKSADSVDCNILRIVWDVSIEKLHHFFKSRAEKIRKNQEVLLEQDLLREKRQQSSFLTSIVA